MARTKPEHAQKKILIAENIRRRQLEQSDPNFRRDLDELKAIAQRLSRAPSDSNQTRSIKIDKPEQVELVEGMFIPKELLPSVDEEAFHKAAERFKEKWNFQPMAGINGAVELFIRMPAGGYKIIQTGEVIEMTRRGKYHADGDVDSLAKHYRSLRQSAREKREKIRNYMQEQKCDYPTARVAVETAGIGLRTSPERRRRIGTEKQRLKARELSAQGKSIAQIAKAMFPKEYKAALKRNLRAEEELRSLTPKYLEPPYKLTWPEAERKAASELGLDLRPRSIKIRTLTRRVRYLLLHK